MCLFLGMLCLCAITVSAQTSNDSYNYGIWQTFGNPMPADQYPELKGRLCNFRWADLETAPNVWNWTEFDSDLTERAKDTLPIIFMVYTESDAPEWLYSNGVPKVAQKDNNGNLIAYTPYYADPAYKSFFRRMITTVHQHIETLPDNVRSKIIAVQGCYGSTGDYIAYKGTVAPEYNLTGTQFYQLFQEFSQYYYDEYRSTNPKIYLLSNPKNDGDDQCLWLMQNCPGGWLKAGTLGKGYQLNDEVSKSGWLYNIINGKQYDGSFVRARSEIIGNGLSSGWWKKCPYKNMFALMCYDIYWGLDWNNQSSDLLSDVLFDSAFNFYNKYAGQKDPLTSTNAMCALKDGLDASDGQRFPENIYGSVVREKSRFTKIANAFKAYGAKLEDADNAVSSENNNLVATGINDVGWGIFQGNYDRYLHQVSANETSVGYWNVQSADPNSMYGRFARGFDVASGKNALYFDVDNTFLNNAPLNGSYAVMIEVTYLDNGSGSWQLFYDSKSNSNQYSIAVTCTNSGLWKKASVTLKDAYFGNRGDKGADFYIKSTNSENVIFSVVELTRPNTQDGSGAGLSASALHSFDTLCVNSESIQALTVQGAFLNNTKVTIGPLNGFSFATAVDGVYSDSINISNYGSSFIMPLFVKFSSATAGSFSGNIPVKGGGVSTLNVPVGAYAINSSPAVSATVLNISCFKANDGAISLKLSGGNGPFKFSWSNDINRFSSSQQNISDLKPANYTVVTSSAFGCKASATYSITQPEVLTVSLSADTIICKGSTTNLYVTASGGTKPYTGTGTFKVSAGFQSYTVRDANGCSDKASIKIAEGALKKPAKPGIITGNTDTTGVCGNGDFKYFIDPVASATSYTWEAPLNSSVSSMSSDGTRITLAATSNFTNGTLSVIANNVCGSSIAQTKKLSALPMKPGSINGPAMVSANQTGLTYSIQAAAGLTYNWSVPRTAQISSGQGTGKIKVTWGNRDGNVTVNASNGCGSTANSILKVQLSGSLQSSENLENSTISVPAATRLYPNPAKNVVYISFEASAEENYTIEIIDITGKPVMKKLVQSVQSANTVALDIHQLASGLYIVNLVNEKNERKTMKLVKG